MLGSRVYHSDGNFDGEWISDPNDPYDPNNDYAYVESATTVGCCFTESFTLPLCLPDLTWDGKTDLADLSQLLSNYGMTSGATQPDGDIDGDGDVDLADLAALLSVYGTG